MKTSATLNRDPDKAIMLSIAQVCDLLGIGRSTFYKIMEAGDLKVGKVAGQYRVHRDDLNAFIDRVRGKA